MRYSNDHAPTCNDHSHGDGLCAGMVYADEVMNKKIHGDHDPGENLYEGGVCTLEETILSGTGVYTFWSCGYEDHAHGKKLKHSGTPD